VIDEGMVSYLDVRDGNVTLAEIVRMVHYLDMKSAIKQKAMDDAMKGVK
jgi:hypothetical protein